MFTYDVQWREIDFRWASRWDIYLTMNNAFSDKVHWFSIINSVLIVLFLAFMVAMILIRTLSRDINAYNRFYHIIYVFIFTNYCIMHLFIRKHTPLFFNLLTMSSRNV